LGYVTSYQDYTGTGILTADTPLTTIAPSGTQSGTVIIERPVYYVTSYQDFSGSSILTAPITLTTIHPSGSVSGTVIIATPASAYASTTITPSYLVTSYEAYTGTEGITAPLPLTTIPASGTIPGTGMDLSCFRLL
jgi:hypothetical protein